MKTPLWQQKLPQSITNPSFSTYAAFKETRPVIIDCSLGINPLADLYKGAVVNLPVVHFSSYPPEGPCFHRQLANLIQKRFPKVADEELFFSTGSQGTIVSLSRIVGGPLARIQSVVPTFIPALLEFTTSGASLDPIPLEGPSFTIDVKKIAKLLKPETTLYYLDTPNNPTGQSIALEDIRYLANVCAENGTLLLVDEAYGDFVCDSQSAAQLENTNVICIRSFSKGCGLAGLRLGYAIIKDPLLQKYYRSFSIHYAFSEASAMIASSVLPSLDLSSMRSKMKEMKHKVVSFLTEYPGITIANTHEATPSFLVGWEKGKNLYDALLEVGILTEPSHFFAIEDPCYVRLRIPMEAQLEQFFELWNKRFR